MGKVRKASKTGIRFVVGTPTRTGLPKWDLEASVKHADKMRARRTRAVPQGKPVCLVARELSAFFDLFRATDV